MIAAAVTVPHIRKYICTWCELKYRTVRVLECRHSLCERCFNRIYNKQIQDTLMQGRVRPNRFVCVTCGLISRVPEPEWPALPLMSRSRYGFSDKEKTRKLWRYDKFKHICDMAFYGDGQVMFITYDRDNQMKTTNPQLRALDRDGNTTALPFSVSLKKPVAVASSVDNKCIVVADWPAGLLKWIHVYRETAQGWTCQQFSTTHEIQRIAILPNGRIVGTTTYMEELYVLLVIYEADGKEMLAVELPRPPPTCDKKTCETKFVVEVATSPAGHVIISDPNTDTVCVRDESGRILTTFNSSLIKQPLGVCTDSAGNVMIYDDENNSVSLYTNEGIYQRRIVTPEIVAMGLSLYQDRYLLVRDAWLGIILFDLNV